jgi:hypothetical protein
MSSLLQGAHLERERERKKKKKKREEKKERRKEKKNMNKLFPPPTSIKRLLGPLWA